MHEQGLTALTALLTGIFDLFTIRLRMFRESALIERKGKYASDDRIAVLLLTWMHSS